MWGLARLYSEMEKAPEFPTPEAVARMVAAGEALWWTQRVPYGCIHVVFKDMLYMFRFVCHLSKRGLALIALVSGCRATRRWLDQGSPRRRMSGPSNRSTTWWNTCTPLIAARRTSRSSCMLCMPSPCKAIHVMLCHACTPHIMHVAPCFQCALRLLDLAKEGWNPRLWHTFKDEDLMGIMVRTALKNHRLKLAERTLQRYALRLALLWNRRPAKLRRRRRLGLRR